MYGMLHPLLRLNIADYSHILSFYSLLSGGVDKSVFMVVFSYFFSQVSTPSSPLNN